MTRAENGDGAAGVKGAPSAEPRVHRAALASRIAVPLAALLLGVAVVLAWDAALAPVRYPYFGDSASYVEMAESLRAAGTPRASPWGLESPHADAVPQPLFPPGLPVAIAALAPLAGDARAAALWPNRLAAACLPLLIVLLFRGRAPDAALLGVGAWVLLSPGVLHWHYVAYSDVFALALAIVALGALVRSDGQRRRWLAVAGAAAGCAYAVRNAALAVVLAAVATLALDLLRSRGATWRGALAWCAGAAVPLGALVAWNFATFGALQPYGMPPSARPWTVNLADWVRAQLHDLHVPLAWLEPLGATAAAVLLGAAVLAGVAWWWRTRADVPAQRLIGALGAYVALGGAILVVSRSRYEWADTIEVRHALQYSWAVALLVAIAVSRAVGTRGRRAIGGVAVLVLAAVAVHAVEFARSARAAPPDAWLTIADDARVVAAIRALPRDTLVASNASVLFRVAAGRSVRLVEFAGGDAEFAAALESVRSAAGPRASAYVLWCHSYTARASACATPPPRGGPACLRLRGPPEIVALCGTDGALGGRRQR